MKEIDTELLIQDGDIVVVQNRVGHELEKIMSFFRSSANSYKTQFEISLMNATSLLEEVQKNDDSDFVEGGVDDGISVIDWLKGAPFSNIDKKVWYKKRENQHIDEDEATITILNLANQLGFLLEPLLHRGIKYLSTGEIMRILFLKAFIEPKELLLIYNPFLGMDIASRKLILQMIAILAKGISEKNGSAPLAMVLFLDESYDIPSFVTKLLVFDGQTLSYSGEPLKCNKDIALSNDNTNLPILEKREKRVEEKSPLVIMKNICVSYNQKKVLDNISFDINQYEHTLIQGPNGCGKTTLLELITGDNPQLFSNEIYLFGKRRGSGETIWDIKKEMGIVSYHLHLAYKQVPSTTALEVVLSGLFDSIGIYSRVQKDEIALAMKWLEWAHFVDDRMNPFGNFSYGEQRKLLILRAMIKEPKLLILDEPCHGLDNISKEEILRLFEKIGESGITTIIYATHEQNEILCCTKKIIDFYTMKI